ncbi:glycosyltransferase [Paenibacillus prosopidis]|uniref:Glycosyltransferase involved in cell wall biosynthesis n=1 Tax=Paenibacillus prosopidis TaxID=630520 RepID=A0A368VP23_9BACL|nr:glycosyltransferase [Paenibacillus prosopidis]RCW42725.1 glycosyltransferase involved in cell wall biosynthesis [Paenibacillus prosopidis]
MKKDILISVYDMEIGGIERSLINMLEGFDYEKYNVDLLICSHQGDFMKLIPSQVNVLPEISKYTVFRKPLKQCIQEGHYAATLIRILSRNIALVKAKRRKLQEGPGYIQMQLASKYTSYIIPAQKKMYHLTISYAWPHDILANKVKAHKKVAWIHTDYSKLEIDNKLDLAVWNKFDYIASISEACTESFLKQYPSLEKKITLIENITSPAFIKNMAEETLPPGEFDNDAFKIVSVGRLSYVKGFDMAVQALKTLHYKGFSQIKWYVVGYGGYEAELKEIIAQHGMQDSFILLGKKANPYPYIKKCDLYVQPSRYEGKAVTVTEAQILGKPVLITNYPTAPSQVENGVDGIICELSPEGIAKAIKMLYENYELRNSLVNHIKDQDYSNSSELDKLYQIMA